MLKKHFTHFRRIGELDFVDLLLSHFSQGVKVRRREYRNGILDFLLLLHEIVFRLADIDELDLFVEELGVRDLLLECWNFQHSRIF